MNNIEFRLARKSDLGTIGVLSRDYIERGLGWSWTPERLKKSYQCRDTNILVACAPRVEKGKLNSLAVSRILPQHELSVVGFGIMHYGATEANLNLLAVIPQYRRMGVGKCLVQWLEKSAVTAGIDVIYLQCRQANDSALQFYQKLGYRKLRNLPKYYSTKESAVLMGHDLLLPTASMYLQKPY
jgi:ribosomal-protein-alanine N-acetyltransferase